MFSRGKNKSHHDIFVFDRAHLADIAEQNKDIYQHNIPYPHIVLDNFLPAWAADKLLDVFPPVDSPVWFDYKTRENGHQIKKQGIGTAERLEAAHPFIQNILFAFNSSAFIHFLEKMTGIPELLPDPHLFGGGLHQILPAGKLDVHVDFNYLEQLKLYRRLNAILYLNKDWKPEWEGNLELWSRDARECVHSVAPIFNRCVIFSTLHDSYHGHPKPLACPPDITRKSIALYYYTRDNYEETHDPHSTIWQGQRVS